MKIVNVAKVAVLNQAGQILLLRRGKTDSRRPGEWDFPGGEADPNEDFVAAANRELNEEAGIEVAQSDLKLVNVGTIAHASKDLSANRFLFVVHIDEQPIKLSYEHDEFKWVDIDTALEDFPHVFYNPALRYARDNGLL